METFAKHITISISHALEITAALIIAASLIKLVLDYFHSLLHKASIDAARNARVGFGSAIAVSLELLLGADVLATAIAPSWDDIGKLAAIAVLRTALNYFLGKVLDKVRSEY